MDELDAELRTLDREIAQFVLEAFQREAPDALRLQLTAAMAESLLPLQYSLETLGANLAEARGETARNAQEGARQSASLQADIAGRAQQAEKQAERGASELQQALAKLRSDLALARREIQQTVAAPATPTAGPRPPAYASDEPDRRQAPPRPTGAWLARRLPWLAGGALALIIIVGLGVGVGMVFFGPDGLFAAPQGPVAGAGRTPAGGEVAAPGAPAATDQEGLARVLAQVSGGWSGERRRAALEILCGAGAQATGCPDLQKRWLAGGRSRKEVEAALTVTVAALAETDGCKAPPPAPPASDADPLAAWTCLLTEAGRAPRS